MARLFLQNESATFSSSQSSTVTGSNGSEIVTIGTGTFTFDASFNRGGDTIILSGNAGGYNITRTNTLVTLTSDNGLTSITVPAGAAGLSIQFADATRTLQISNGQVVLGGQIVAQGPAQEVENGPGGDGMGGGGTTPTPVTYTLTTDAPSVAEGDSGTKALTFTVSLDRAPTAPVTINYSTTTGGTATPNTDFQPVSGTLTFAAGQTTATVSVLVNGDVAQEGDETILLNFSGAALVAAVTATGTIVNDDLGQQLTAQNDIILGTAADEVFEAFNNTLNAGDRIDGAGGNDVLRLSVDGSVNSRNYSGFTLSNIESLEVTNDSNSAVTLDLSGSTGIQTLRVVNSSDEVYFNQVTQLADVELDNITNPADADTFVQFRDAVVAGANDSIALRLSNTDAGLVRVGSVSDANGGIEEIRLSTTAAPTAIGALDSDITRLIIDTDTAGSIVIGTGFGGNVSVNPNVDPDALLSLNSTIRSIDAGGSTGAVTLNFSGATGGVTYSGSSGNDRIAGSASSDVIVTGEGDDLVYGNGGSDSINVGNGTNFVSTRSVSGDIVTVTGGSGVDTVIDGAGNATISTGAGADSVDISAGGNDVVMAGAGNDIIRVGRTDGSFVNALNNADTVDGGEGVDTLLANAGLFDGNFERVSSVEILRVESSGTTQLGGNDSVSNFAQRAGLATVYVENGGNDVLDASSFTSGLTVFARGGSDTIRTGRGADTVNMQGDGSLTDADILNGDGTGGGLQGRDTLNLSGDTTVSAASQFTGFEQINLGSARGTNDAGNAYSFQLDNDNAPTGNGTLTIDGGTLSGTVSINPFQTAETVNLNAALVTAYALDVTTGGANDVIVSGTGNGRFVTGNGNDTITLIGGINTVLAGEGADDIFTLGGINRIEAGGGADEITLGAATDTVLGEGGDDIVYAGANLTSADSIEGGEGNDTLRIGDRNYGDVDFTNVRTTETLVVTTDTNVTLGAAASNSGFTTVVSAAAGASVINAGTYGSGLTFDLTAGGDDQVTGTAFADTVVMGVGNNVLTLGAGEDRVIVSGSELTGADVISGGAIADGVTDTIELDNRGGQVNATVNLTNVTSIEAYEFTFGGNRTIGTDADNNTLTFTNGNVGSVTDILIDASAVTDSDDSVTVTIDTSVIDADFAFTVTGAGAGVETNVVKLNAFTNTQNNITFNGRDGDDNLVIAGNDLGGTVEFSGGGGLNSIRQIGGTGSLISDDGFRDITGVQVLTFAGAQAGFAAGISQRVNATLGTQASRSGLTTIIGGTDSESVVFDAGFARGLTIDLRTTSGGNDVVNAGAVSAAFSFLAQTAGFDANDVLTGGTTAGDTLTLRSTGSTSVATSIANIETITFDKAISGSQIGNQGTVISLDTKTGELQSAGGVLTVNAEALDADDVLDLSVTNSAADDANYDITAGAASDRIVTGQGVDTVFGQGGNDTISAGAGSDTIYGGNGNDDINGEAGDDKLYGGADNDRIAGGIGDDLIEGEQGDDMLRGDDGNDIIMGGAGSDRIYGGLGADVLDGGSGADIFYYAAINESAPSTARDIINNWDSSDAIDIRSIAAGQGLTINFVGNLANFADAQGAIQGGDGDIDVVFQQDNNVLWFDINNDGQLDGNDLQIVLTGVTEITGANVFSGSVVNFVDLNIGFNQFNNDFTAMNMA